MEDNTLILKTLRASSLFKKVDDKVLSQLAEQMTLQTLQGGDLLIEQGGLSDCLYLLVYGRLMVYQNGRESRTIAEIGAGEVVGELGILMDTPRTANVCAIRDCALIKITRTLFEWIAQHHPTAALNILSSCVRRLLPDYKEHHHALKTLCIVPCDDKLDIHKFTLSLFEALSPYAKVKIIKNDERLDREHMESLDSQYDLLLFSADHALNEWTKECIRQSDRIMFVCDATASPSLGVAEYIHQNTHIKASCELTLVHSLDTEHPEGTDTFLKALQPARHFHVRTQADYERLGRYLLGRSITVVFSGGGLRGVAHHGLVRALEERNIPIDMTAGVSFGSLLSFMLAHQYKQEKLRDVWADLAPEIERVLDITLPITSLARGKRLYDLLTRAFGLDSKIEDLWLPAFCTSTNLTDYDVYVHTHGLVWQAIRASMSLPVIFPPVVMNDKLLVDGASFNNLPVDIMKSYNNQGIIIASTVSETTDNHGYHSGEQGVSGWSALVDQLFHHPHEYPRIGDIIMDSSLAASVRHQRTMSALADFTIDLGVGEYGMLDVKVWKAVMQQGYENACKHLDEQGVTRKSLGLT